MKSILIKDTTRAECAAIVRQSLAGCGEGSCEFCSGCSMGLGSIEKMYAPYIEGELEIAEIDALHGATRIERG